MPSQLLSSGAERVSERRIHMMQAVGPIPKLCASETGAQTSAVGRLKLHLSVAHGGTVRQNSVVYIDRLRLSVTLLHQSNQINSIHRHPKWECT
jgi:hypothetical protein